MIEKHFINNSINLYRNLLKIKGVGSFKASFINKLLGEALNYNPYYKNSYNNLQRTYDSDYSFSFWTKKPFLFIPPFIVKATSFLPLSVWSSQNSSPVGRKIDINNMQSILNYRTICKTFLNKNAELNSRTRILWNKFASRVHMKLQDNEKKTQERETFFLDYFNKFFKFSRRYATLQQQLPPYGGATRSRLTASLAQACTEPRNRHSHEMRETVTALLKTLALVCKSQQINPEGGLHNKEQQSALKLKDALHTQSLEHVVRLHETHPRTRSNNIIAKEYKNFIKLDELFQILNDLNTRKASILQNTRFARETSTQLHSRFASYTHYARSVTNRPRRAQSVLKSTHSHNTSSVTESQKEHPKEYFIYISTLHNIDERAKWVAREAVWSNYFNNTLYSNKNPKYKFQHFIKKERTSAHLLKNFKKLDVAVKRTLRIIPIAHTSRGQLLLKDASARNEQIKTNSLICAANSNFFLFNEYLNKFITDKKSKLIEINNYKGRRMKLGFPIRGQRTKSNAKTAKKRYTIF